MSRGSKLSFIVMFIRKLRGFIRMEVQDDGKSFKVPGVSSAQRSKGLGRLGMPERVEMVGGRFAVESSPGKSTTIRAKIPFGNGAKG